MSAEDSNLSARLDQEDADLYDEKCWKVDPGQTPLRLDKFLSERLQGVSRNRIQIAIKNGAVKVNKETVKSNYKVRPGDKVVVVLPKPSRSMELLPEEIPLEIIFEDQDVLVVNKPAGLVVHPGSGNWTGTLVNGLLHHLRQAPLPVLAGNEDDRPGLVHRIDKDTSGLLVVAKNDLALTHLAKQFYDRTVGRSYLALIWGQPDQEEGMIDMPIGRHPKNRMLQTAFLHGEGGKYAVTHFRVIEPMYYVSLVRCRLETGRTHQIRVHMKSIGHPLFGDTKYGGDRIVKGTVFQKYRQFVQNCFRLLPHHALHAESLAFQHPVSGQRMEFVSEPPEDFAALVDKWRSYLEHRKKTE